MTFLSSSLKVKLGMSSGPVDLRFLRRFILFSVWGDYDGSLLRDV